MAVLRDLATAKTRTHRQRFIGRDLDAITLHTQPELERNGRTAAISENFLPLDLAGHREANQLIRVTVIAVNPEGSLIAAKVQEKEPQ
jgi:hypothetical protein